MARLAVSAAAAVAATFLGGPSAGFAAFSATYGLTGFLDPAQKTRGPRIDDLKATTASYGTPIPLVYGHPRVAGAIVWCSDKQEVAHRAEQGGKGGPSAETTTYTYKIDVRILLSANPIGGVRRIWSNGKLIWCFADTADAETLIASAETDAWERITIYTGAADQMPDPVEEAALGIGNCPAYRGRGSVFIEGLNLGGSGYLPNLTFEIGEPAPVGEAPNETLTAVDTSSYGSLQVGTTDYQTGYAIFAEKTTLGPDVQHVYAYGLGTSTPTESIVSLSGVGLGSGGVTPIGGTSDCDSLVFTLPVGGAYGYFGGGGYSHYDYTGGDASCYLVEGGNVWLSSSDLKLMRFAKSGGAPATTATMPFSCRSFAKVGASLYGAGEDGNLYRWNATSLAQTGSWPLQTLSNKMLCTDGTTLYDVASSNDLVAWDGASWSIFCADLGPDFSTLIGPSGSQHAPVMRGSSIYLTRMVGSVLTTVRADLTPRVALNPAPLEDVLRDLCVRSGLPESYLNFSSCSGQVVRDVAVSQVTPARQVMEMLGAAYLQDFVESGGVLKTVARGGPSVATIPYEDLGASQGDQVEPLPIKRVSDVEIPGQVAIVFRNVLNDYQTATAYSDRSIFRSH